MQAQIINNRAKLSADLTALDHEFSVNYRNVLSTNPKTEKSKIQTYILHLAPHNTSGIQVCPGAGNCKKICLHFAGNPVYMEAKQSARVRRTLAYAADPARFARLIVCAILAKINKTPGETIAIRLNGTSDIPWENVDFMITHDFSALCRIKFGHSLPIGKRNIFEVFNAIGANVVFYDYTKIARNWAECKRLGYDLTFSFDGWDNTSNLKIAKSALLAGVNVAAAFNLKRGESLPSEINAAGLNLPDSAVFHPGKVLPVLDGDLSDYRPGDSKGGYIVGLRFKLPHGLEYTEAEKKAFCLA